MAPPQFGMSHVGRPASSSPCRPLETPPSVARHAMARSEKPAAATVLRLGSRVELLGSAGWTPAVVDGALAPGRFRLLVGDGAVSEEISAGDGRLRPEPPAADDGFANALEGGEKVEALLDGSWRRVTLLGTKVLKLDGGARQLQCTVRTAAGIGSPATEESLPADKVRPCWRWDATTGWQHEPGTANASRKAAGGEAAEAIGNGAEAATKGRAAAQQEAGRAGAAVEGHGEVAEAEAAGAAEEEATAEALAGPEAAGEKAGAAEAEGEVKGEAEGEAAAAGTISAGDAMELTSEEVGLRGSWYTVTVAELNLPEAAAGAEGEAPGAEGGAKGEVLVKYDAEGYGEERVARCRLRPPPPPLSAAPPSWPSRLRHGEALQLSYEQGWYTPLVLLHPLSVSTLP